MGSVSPKGPSIHELYAKLTNLENQPPEKRYIKIEDSEVSYTDKASASSMSKIANFIEESSYDACSKELDQIEKVFEQLKLRNIQKINRVNSDTSIGTIKKLWLGFVRFVIGTNDAIDRILVDITAQQMTNKINRILEKKGIFNQICNNFLARNDINTISNPSDFLFHGMNYLKKGIKEICKEVILKKNLSNNDLINTLKEIVEFCEESSLVNERVSTEISRIFRRERNALISILCETGR